jgi:predicted permease
MIAAGPAFFETVGMGLLQGRFFTAHDVADSPPVAVVNESFARYYFGRGSALGHRFRQRRKDMREIVGVVRDVRHYGVRDQAGRTIYLPTANGPQGSFFFRASASAASLNNGIRAEVGALDKSAEFDGVHPVAAAVDDMISQERLTAMLSALFGALALVLAAVGLYGVVAYGVSRRTREFGIRMALGAQRANVQRLVLRQTLALVGAGIMAGLVAACALARMLAPVLSGMLYGIQTGNADVFVGAASLLAAITLLAAFLPARRAARIDPMVALRYE